MKQLEKNKMLLILLSSVSDKIKGQWCEIEKKGKIWCFHGGKFQDGCLLGFY